MKISLRKTKFKNRSVFWESFHLILILCVLNHLNVTQVIIITSSWNTVQAALSMISERRRRINLHNRKYFRYFTSLWMATVCSMMLKYYTRIWNWKTCLLKTDFTKLLTSVFLFFIRESCRVASDRERCLTCLYKS